MGRKVSRDGCTAVYQSVQAGLETESVGDPLKPIVIAEMVPN